MLWGNIAFNIDFIAPKLIDDLMEIGLKCGWIVRYMGVRKKILWWKNLIVFYSLKDQFVIIEKLGH